jgi:hemerythrin HHE cation binding domain-containing protein
MEIWMEITSPAPLRAEHEELHRELAAATKIRGRVGEAARAVAKLLHPHFVDEEAFALPPLGVLAPLARGERITEAESVTAMTDRLKAELPRMLAEHRAITAALQELKSVARVAGDEARVRLAERIIGHARAEEEVMYPAAILAGEYLKQTHY